MSSGIYNVYEYKYIVIIMAYGIQKQIWKT